MWHRCSSVACVVGNNGLTCSMQSRDPLPVLFRRYLSYMSLTADVVCPAKSDFCPTHGGVMDAFRVTQFDAPAYVDKGWYPS